MKRSLSFLLAGSLLLASCALEEVTSPETAGNEAVPVTATIGAETKTTLGSKEDGAYKVLWSKGDRIAVRTGNATAQTSYVTSEEGETTATFTAEDINASPDFTKGAIAVYPAEGAEINATDKVYLTIPQEQSYAEGSFDDDAMPMVSSFTRKPEFTFHNAAGALNLQLYTTLGDFDVKSVTITTTEGFLSGKCRYIPETRTYKTDDAASAYYNKVVLNCGKGVTIGKNARSFFVVVPHGEYKDLAICVKSTKGLEQTFNLKDGKTLAVDRASVLNIPLLANKMAEPEYPTISIDWSYEQGAVWTENLTLAEAPEFEVNGIDDITVLKDKNGNSFSPITPLTFKATAADKAGKTYDATAEIVSLTKRAVRLTGGNIPYAKGEELTYKFTAKLYDDKAVEYTVHFNVKTAAMPKDRTIVLDEVKIDGRFSSPMYAIVTPVTETLEADMEYYPEAATAEGKEALLTEFFKQAADNESTLTVKQNGTKITGAAFDLRYDADAKEETSLLTIPEGISAYDDEYAFTKTINVFGVTYTYKVTAVIKPLGFSIERNPMWVSSDNTVNLVGKVELPTFKKNVGTENGVEYSLPLIDVRDYVLVNGETETDKAYHELSLKYKVTTVKKDDQGNVIKSDDDFAALSHDVTFTDTEAQDATNVLVWNTNDEDALYRNTLDLEIELVATANHQISYGSVNITIVVPELVIFSSTAPDKSTKTGAYSEYLNEMWTPVNVVKALIVKDAKTGNDLYNAYAADIYEFWDGYNYDPADKTYCTAAGTGHFNIYGQTELEIDFEKVTAVFASSGATVASHLYNIDDNGDVALANNTAHITDDIIIRVPVSFKHNFCGTEHSAVAEIRFYK